MVYYKKDLNDKCSCAQKNDALWFLDHLDRRKHVREPWECEAVKDLDDGVVQIIVVWLDKSLSEIVLDDLMSTPVKVQIRRRSFLFEGTGYIECRNDNDVDHLLALIDDDGEIGRRPN